MVSYYGLYIDEIHIDDGKNVIPDDILSVFQSKDRKILHHEVVRSDYNYLHNDSIDGSEEDLSYYYFYIAKRESVAQRLDIAGINYERMRADFQEGIKEYRDLVVESHKNSKKFQKEIKKRSGDKSSPVLRLDIDGYTFEVWLNNVRLTLEERIRVYKNGKSKSFKEVISYSFKYFSETFGFPFERYDTRYLLRIALDMFSGENVILVYTDLVINDYMSPHDDPLETAKEYDGLSIPIFGKAIVLTEGTSDNYFLSSCLKIIYPDLSESIHFVDFGEVNAAGGASQVVAFIKILAAAGIRNRVIAIFDADTAAQDALKGLNGVNLPSNITVILLPEKGSFSHWPTIGPQGENIEVDINKKAVSLELFFPAKLLRDEAGVRYPIQWKGFNSSLRQYQGEIVNKDGIQRKFREMIEAHKNKTCVMDLNDIQDMKILIDFMLENLKYNYSPL